MLMLFPEVCMLDVWMPALQFVFSLKVNLRLMIFLLMGLPSGLKCGRQQAIWNSRAWLLWSFLVPVTQLAIDLTQYTFLVTSRCLCVRTEIISLAFVTGHLGGFAAYILTGFCTLPACHIRLLEWVRSLCSSFLLRAAKPEFGPFRQDHHCHVMHWLVSLSSHKS